MDTQHIPGAQKTIGTLPTPALLLLQSITPVLIFLCITHHLVPPSWYKVLLGPLGLRHWQSPAAAPGPQPQGADRQTDIPRVSRNRIMDINRNP